MHPDEGLGFRRVLQNARGIQLTELDVHGTPIVPATSSAERVVRVAASKFKYEPSTIEATRGERLILELVSLDRLHGFSVPDFGIRVDVKPDVPTRVALQADRVGRFAFHCDLYCGDGHESMVGEIVVRA